MCNFRNGVRIFRKGLQKNKMNIQITGASGSGKTFLGKTLSKILNCHFIDTDDILWVWKDNVQPYTIAVSDEQACEILKNELINNKSTIASGMFYPWSEPVIDKCDLLIMMETSDDGRRKRSRDRAYEMHGDRFKKVGDMYEQFNSYLEWAMNYNYSNDKLGCKKETENWAKKFNCEILYLNGNKTIDEKVNIIMKKIKKNK